MNFGVNESIKIMNILSEVLYIVDVDPIFVLLDKILKQFLCTKKEIICNITKYARVYIVLLHFSLFEYI